MLKIKDRIRNNILPSCMGLFDLQSEVLAGKNVIKIVLASGPEKPYYKKKYGMSERGCFIRNGTASDPMPQKIIDELFAKRTRNSLGKIVSRQQGLTFEQIKIYYQAIDSKLNEHFTKNLELLSDSGELNYVAYLLSDNNTTSIKVARYKGVNRADLHESNEYGHSCLVRSAKQVLDKIEVENKTITHITSKERKVKKLWDPLALREAIINAFVHNDFTGEIPPKFELFSDRIEITSAGGIPEGLSKQEFFEGYSVPRNKELMRVFKDLNLVEQLGSGVPRILESYNKKCFTFTDNFLRMAFPINGGQVGGQVGLLTSRQKEVLELIIEDPGISRKGLSEKLGINESAVQKHIMALKRRQVISRESETTGYWKILIDKQTS